MLCYKFYMDQKIESFKINTAYNSIHLVYHRGKLELRGRDKSLQSVINLAEPHQLEPINLQYLMSALLFIPAPQRILMLGTAAGSLLHFLRHHYPQAHVTAVDIDRELIEQLLDHAILPAADDRLDYVYANAADYIQNCQQQFDLVLVDVFHGSQSPAWLLTKASIQRLHHLLTERGALAFNLLVDSDHDFTRFYRELRLQFRQQALSLPVPDLENKVVYGIRGKTEVCDMTANMGAAMELSSQLNFDLIPILSMIYNTNPVGQGLI
jgi:spermidine synthase